MERPVMTETTTPGFLEIDDSGSQPRVRFTLPQEWFTLRELRMFADYLTTVADENEPSPEVDALATLLDTARLLGCGPRDAARRILAAGFKRAEAAGPLITTHEGGANDARDNIPAGEK